KAVLAAFELANHEGLLPAGTWLATAPRRQSWPIVSPDREPTCKYNARRSGTGLFFPSHPLLARCRMIRLVLFVGLVVLPAPLLAQSASLPEGEGLAAKYPGDRGIGKDPA